MDFELPEELRIFKDSLRRFVDNEMIPIEREASTDTEKLKPEYYERFCQRAKDLGFWQMDIPAEYGGAGFLVAAPPLRSSALAPAVGVAPRGLGRARAPGRGVVVTSLDSAMQERRPLP